MEFALVLPILVTLLLGTATVGLAYNAHLALTNAVREGSRFGATTPVAGSWGDAVATRTTTVYFNADYPLEQQHVCAKVYEYHGAWTQAGSFTGGCTYNGVSGDEPAIPTPAAGGPEDGDCIVKVWAKKPAQINIVVASWSFDIAAQSVSSYLRSCGGATP